MPLKRIGIVDEVNDRQSRLKKVEPPEETQPRPLEGEMGPADYLNAIWEGYKGGGELLLQGLTGAVATPVSGMAGLAKTITSGPEAGAESIKQIQEALTYQPRGEAVPTAIGMAVEGAKKVPGVAPTAEFVGKIPESIGDLSYEGALALGLSPDSATYFGAAGKSALPVAIELMGIKGSKVAKRGLLKRVIDKADKTDFYDDAGKLLPEIKQAAKEAGVETADFLPETIDVKKAAGSQVEQIKEATGTRIGQAGKLSELTTEARINPEIMEAAKEFELEADVLASHASENPVYRAVEQGLKSIPGSQLSATEKNLIENLGKKADDLIEEFGGQVDKAELSDTFRSESRQLIDSLGDSAENAYKKVNDAIPNNLPVKTDNIITEIKSMADDLGGEKYLNPAERRLLNALDPKTKPTYARLDKYRRQIGEAMRGKESIFKNSDHATLSKLYNRLTADQEAVASAQGVGDLYKTAKNLVVERKGIENQLTAALGKELQDNISNKAKSALLPMMKGNTGRFDKLLDNIPSQLGKETRKNIVATALNDAFTLGSRKEMSLNVPGFDDFMNGLKRHPSAYRRLESELGKESMARLNKFHKLVGGVRRAQQDAITTGRTLAVPGMFDEVENIAQKLYGTGKKIAAAEGVSSTVGAPGIGTAGVIGSMLSAKKAKRSVAADKLLSDPKFRNLIKDAAAGKMDNATKMRNANNLLSKIKVYQEWKKTLPESDLNDLAVVGALGYFTGKTQQEPQQ